MRVGVTSAFLSTGQIYSWSLLDIHSLGAGIWFQQLLDGCDIINYQEPHDWSREIKNFNLLYSFLPSVWWVVSPFWWLFSLICVHFKIVCFYLFIYIFILTSFPLFSYKASILWITLEYDLHTTHTSCLIQVFNKVIWTHPQGKVWMEVSGSHLNLVSIHLPFNVSICLLCDNLFSLFWTKPLTFHVILNSCLYNMK